MTTAAEIAPTAPARALPRRFALVSGDFVKTGGMDRANHALASHLARRGDAEVHLVSHRIAADLEASPAVVLHRVPKPLNSYMLGSPLIHREGRRVAARMAAAGARVVVNGGNCFFGDVNWVHHVHASDPHDPRGGPLNRIKGRLNYRTWIREERKAVAMARLVVTTCQRNRADLAGRLGVDDRKIRTAYYGIDAEIFRPADDAQRAALRRRLGLPEGRPLVAFVGALGDRRKGFDTLFAAWKALCGSPSWDADLVVAGSGAELPAWKARAGADAALADRIHFLGFRRDVPDILRACDAHCLPSRYEGYSLVTQEALCCGLPAFITHASGIAERYPEGLRALVLPDPEDLDDLVSRLRSWWGDRPSYRASVADFAADLRSRSWDDMAAEVVAYIEGAA